MAGRAKKVVVVLSGVGHVDVAAYAGSVSAYSFIQTYGLLTKAMSVCVATPGGHAPKFQCEDEEEQAWIDQNKALVAHPADLADINSADWDGLCIPSSVGAVVDLGTSGTRARETFFVEGSRAARSPGHARARVRGCKQARVLRRLWGAWSGSRVCWAAHGMGL